MLKYEIKNAKEKDIDILSSMRLVTMLNEEMDRGLSPLEKNKVHQQIVQDVSVHFEDYQLVYSNHKVVGAFLLVPYLDGKMLDMLFLFDEYRRQGLGTSLIHTFKEQTNKLYVWCYKKQKELISFFKKLGFVMTVEQGSRVIYVYDCISSLLEDVMGNIKVGYKCKDGSFRITIDEHFSDIYRLQSASDLQESYIGLCFDQVELERKLFSAMKVSFRTYLLLYDDKKLNKGHTFLVFKDKEKYYWFEHAWFSYKGVHAYSSKEELLQDVMQHFIETIPNGNINLLQLYQYDKPRSGISFTRFLSNAINGKRVKVR